ncbi:ABC transporter ATP-binding protein [Roseateles saccharophilus]|uniref:ATP-binding cassette subfamily B protein/ATP-binding cassette subfamily C protein/ATP-binding cassette subfamily B multidrug efflux pump n=1 Tax=Roseateles saccharophilus TaxID=304 RepID=A0A4V2VSE8_ROSSA|nr:ABC transporter ATP-binding protein [Roseateles saccharophilus]MDG0832988.1 ABC transporter ATP-binding protein [Roseateles saccharophilus]TCV02080.1 ATP-binding cassette subfamily B protein/ATP-binding cassette subfamily C protein/ATP-binding cassette subfamily B multidrug efflux pump [Roseateles saccharophilus]
MKQQQASPWKSVGLLLDTARPERAQLVRGGLWLVIAAGLEALGPILGKRYIDHHLLPGRYVIGEMATLLGLMLFTGWAATWIRYAQLSRMAGVARRSVLRLRERVYAHVLALPMSFFDKAITGQLVSRVTNDTEAVNQLYRQVLYVMLDSTIVVVGSLIAMALLDWRLMLIVATLVPAMVIIIAGYQRLSAPAVQRTRQLRSDINAQMAESMAGMAVLQASGAAARFGARFEATNAEHRLSRIAELRANAWLLRPALDLLNVLLLVTVIYSFGRRELSGLEVGLLYAFLSYIARVVEPLIQITMQFGQLQQSMVAASRVRTLLEEDEHRGPAQDGHGIALGAIRIEALSFGYDPARPVLRGIDVDIAAGSFVGIVGHTGSGKSTLLSLLLRFYTAQAGRITVDGQPLASVPDAAFRAAVGLVPQEPYLMSASVHENIAMGRPGITDEDVEDAARAARAHDFIAALPQGYDTRLGEGGARVSTGQKQLLAMARALAGAPSILFLDEATSNIDSATEQRVGEALAALHGRVTVVAIAHRLSTIRAADQILVLNHGHLQERGRHEALMALEGGLYRRLVELRTLEEAGAESDPEPA